MKMRSIFLFCLFGAVAAGADRPAGFVSTEDFARSPLYSSVQLSPDGETVGFIREREGNLVLMFAHLKSMQLHWAKVGDAPWLNATQEIISFQWISDRRVVFSTGFWDVYFGGVNAVDCDFHNMKPLTGLDSRQQLSVRPLIARTVVHAFDDESHSILMLDQGYGEGSDLLFQNVIKVDTTTGGYDTVVKNPSDVVSWATDIDGVVRAGATRKGKSFGLIYRVGAEDKWQKVPATPGHSERIRPIALDPDSKKIYVAALSPKGRWSIYLLDPVTGELGDLILGDPDFDVAPPGFGGSRFSRPVIARKTRRLLGVFYMGDGPRCVWLDPKMQAYQGLLDRSMPKTMNAIVGMTRDESQFLVYSFSDRDPGSYYLFNTKGYVVRRLMAEFPWIKPETMAPMYPIKYPARDGRVIHGYMTMPIGRGKTHLPLIVLPHGGPASRNVWSYDALVQFLANRGYAVLQMNYRGSTGYGEDFSKLLKHQIGRTVQDDIEDGTRWAIAHKIADPDRVAILGADYGGYSALFALGRSPGLYRCGISIDGITDWVRLIRGMSGDEQQFVRQHWVEQLGDPKTDIDYLEAVSPVDFADKITAPVLIIHGKEDHVVPPKQSHVMISALEKAGHPPDSLFLSNWGHMPFYEKPRTEAFKRIEAFLEKNMAPRAAGS